VIAGVVVGHLGECVYLAGNPLEIGLGYAHGAQTECAAEALGMIHGAEARQRLFIEQTPQAPQQLRFADAKFSGRLTIGAGAEWKTALQLVDDGPVGGVEDHW